MCGKSSLPARVLSVEQLGVRDVFATQTSTRTLVANGFLSHNSTIRPRGADIKKLGSQASGPVSFMGIFDAICKCVQSAGHRRGAQMAALRVDHPDTEEFIHAKQNSDHLTGFNMSIAITDKFMEAVEADTSFNLIWGGEVWQEVDARTLWEKIMRSTWDWAEPGVLFIDRINSQNNLWYVETIAGTNPCGEQPLQPLGACLLGSFNLVKYLKKVGEWQTAIPTPAYEFDFTQFRKDIAPVVAAMDRVNDTSTFPLEAQRIEALSKRRMGLGVTGLANAGEALGFKYGSIAFLDFEREVLEILRDEAYRASATLAREKGPFPAFDRIKYLEGKFIRTLPEDIRTDIAKCGIRNSHLLSIAPTGTISLCADNVSSGIEPTFLKSVRRTVQTFDGPEEHTLADYAHANLGIEPTECADVTASEHLDVLIVAQQYMDSAVSKTCNVSSNMPWEDFKDLYMRAWSMGCKGLTTFQSGGKRVGILEKEDAACKLDTVTGRKDCE